MTIDALIDVLAPQIVASERDQSILFLMINSV
jgi:hypothetical protein